MAFTIFALALSLGSSARAQDISYADFNHDGVVDRDEGRAYADLLWSGLAPNAEDRIDRSKLLAAHPEAARLLKIVPARPDGYVYQADFAAALDARFLAADKNGDGLLDATELPQYLPNF